MSQFDGLAPDIAALAAELIRLAADEGIVLRIVSTRRTCAKQNSLYAQGRTTPGSIVTKARGCVSWHVWGQAFDVTVVGPSTGYARAGQIGKSLGLRWGGDFPGFPDAPHFEYHPGYTIEQACPDPDACVDDAILGSRAPPPVHQDDEPPPVALAAAGPAQGLSTGLVVTLALSVLAVAYFARKG